MDTEATAFDDLFERACASANESAAAETLVSGPHGDLLSQPSRSGDTYFEVACARGATAVVEAALRLRQQSLGLDSSCCLYRACESGAKEVMSSYLLRAPLSPATLNYREPASQNNAFLVACANGHVDIVKILLRDPRIERNARNARQKNAFILACEEGHVEVAEELVAVAGEIGLDLNARDDEGCTAFFRACQNHQAGVVRLLLNNQDRIDIRQANADHTAPRDVCGPNFQALIDQQVAIYNADRPRFMVQPADIRRRAVSFAEGGFGDVYHGELNRGGWQRVVVKVIRGPLTNDTKREFQQELNIWAILHPHPNVLALLAYCEMDTEFQIASEFADGGDLHRYLYGLPADPKRGRAAVMGKAQLDRQRYLSYGFHLLLDVAKGMDHLHQNNIVHGDLKPGNVVVVNGVGKIADFGASRVRMSVSAAYSRTNYGPGTYRFQAPEVLALRTAGLPFRKLKSSDVYSWGLMLHQIWAWGHEPFTQHNPPAIEHKDLHIEARHQRPTTPITIAEIGSLVADCWERDMDARPSFAQAVARMEPVVRARARVRPPP
ncbi:kinase-like domain-containing protein [Hyaloraphidium curvatum]|nr:kinase-like domain-containing protein [Hyaloraphidium curvatum]